MFDIFENYINFSSEHSAFVFAVCNGCKAKGIEPPEWWRFRNICKDENFETLRYAPVNSIVDSIEMAQKHILNWRGVRYNV